jgi:hypothetical protein
MLFLTTQSGLIAAKHLVRIGNINHRPAPIPAWHEIDYNHSGEAKSTRATAESVNLFFDAIARRNLNSALSSKRCES